MVSCIIIVAVNKSEDSYKKANLDLVKTNINKAVMTCYTSEGFYPDSLDYLKANYGLIIDETKINVFYEALGSNLYPDIMVTYKGK